MTHTTKSQEAFEAWFRIESLAQNISHQDAQYGYEAGIAYGRKQALEEAVEICESTKQGGINGHMAATRCAKQIKELIK